MKKKVTTLRQRSKDDILLKRFSKRVKTLIHVIAIILVFIFSWLEFHDLIEPPMFTDILSNIFFKILLALYYLSWILGTSLDIKDEEYVLLIAPTKGQLEIMAIMTILTIGGIFAWLCSVHNLQEFAIALSFFFVFNILSWIYLKHYLKNPLDESKIAYEKEKDLLGVYKTDTVHNFLWGRWQLDRFGFGLFFIIVINILSFTNLSEVIASKLDIPSSQFIIVLSIFMFFCVMEIWIWWIRIKRNITFEVIESLKENNIV